MKKVPFQEVNGRWVIIDQVGGEAASWGTPEHGMAMGTGAGTEMASKARQ